MNHWSEHWSARRHVSLTRLRRGTSTGAAVRAQPPRVPPRMPRMAAAEACERCSGLASTSHRAPADAGRGAASRPGSTARQWPVRRPVLTRARWQREPEQASTRCRTTAARTPPKEPPHEHLTHLLPRRTGAGHLRGRFHLSRRGLLGTATAATGATFLGGVAAPAASGLAPRQGGPDGFGFGSVSTAPRLPAGFTRTFKSRYVQANGIRQHIVTGGSGPALLLVHGWPRELVRLALPDADPGRELHRRRRRPARHRAERQDDQRIRLSHPRHRPRRADDPARPRAVRRRRPRHRDGDLLRAGRRPSRPGRQPRRRRGPRATRSAGDAHRPPAPADVRPRGLEQQALAHPVQPGQRRADHRHGQEQRERLLPLRVLRSRAAGRRCRTTPSTTTSSCTPATGTPCAPASVSTAPGTRTWRRTWSARRPR